MKSLILFCFLILNLAGLTQTNCPYYDKYIRIGDSILEKKGKADFKAAIYSYSTAMLHCPDSAQKARKKILEVFNAIEKLKTKAEHAEKISKDALAETVKAKAETQTALGKANKLIDAFYFYDGKFALAVKEIADRYGRQSKVIYVKRYGFINKQGDEVIKYKYEKAEQFDYTGFARVKGKDENKKVTDYLIDTAGKEYRVAYKLTELKKDIIALDLGGQELHNFPEEILEQTQLQILLLNQTFLQILPAKIGQLKALQTLDLSSYQLSVLPPEVGQLNILQTLNLSYNRLNVLPREILQLKALKNLDLSHNELNVFPPGIEQLSTLKSLNLSSTGITDLPTEIGQLKNLQMLDLSNNRSFLFTVLPPEIGRLESLQTLDLSNNLFKSLPSEIGQLKNLKTLNLKRNTISEKELQRIHKLLPECTILVD